MKKLLPLLMALGLCFVLGGCTAGQSNNGNNGNANQDNQTNTDQLGNSDTKNQPFTFTDSCGNTFSFSHAITRVAVSGPVAQQIMLSFAPEMLVGLSNEIDPQTKAYVSSACYNLPVFGQLYGTKGTLDKESVAAVNPDVIIDWGEGKKGIKEDLQTLSNQLGIPVVHIEATLDTYPDAYTMLGKLLGKEARAKELADYCTSVLQDTVTALNKRSATLEARKSGLVIIDTVGLAVIAQGSYQAQVIDLALSNDAVLDNPSAKGTGNQVDLEQICTWNPKILFVAGDALYNTVMSDPVWATIDAVKNHQVYPIPPEPYNWLFNPPSVNQLLGLQWTARLLYPTDFTTSAYDAVKEYFRVFYNYDLTEAAYQKLTGLAAK